MKIALFLAVDGVLTQSPVNQQLACFLAIEDDYLPVDQDFLAGTLSNDDFNKQLITMFRAAGFTRSFVEENFDRIDTRLHYERLLSSVPDVFLVSSSPDYYTAVLAERNSIPPERVRCSKYAFDGDGKID